MALTCLLPFLSPDASGLCSSFFSGHYIPSGLISLISHWLGCQNSFLHYCSLLKGSGCWILYHIPFDLLWIFFFFYNVYFFFLLCLSQWQKKRINYFYEASTSLCVKVLANKTYLSQERAFLPRLRWMDFSIGWTLDSLRAGSVCVDSLGRASETGTVSAGRSPTP